MIVGHKKVTEDVYLKATREQKEQAVRFAEAAVWNGLGGNCYELSDTKISQLKTQIERDFLVFLVNNDN